MWIISIIVCIFLIALDQITKWIALTKLKPIETITVIQNFLDFTFVENRGAAFGILSGQRSFFIILTLIVSCVIVYIFYKTPINKEYNKMRVSLVLIFAGAIGNLIDRMIRGYVVDFFEFKFISWPVFNMADIYVVIGTIYLIWLLIFVIKEEPKDKKVVSATAEPIKENVSKELEIESKIEKDSEEK